MTPLEQYCLDGRKAGCPRGQMLNFAKAEVVLQARQLAASAAARLCDRADGGGLRRGVGAVASRIGCSRRWGPTIASACRG